MRLRFLDVAELELDEAIAWYRDKDTGIADRLVAEVVAARDMIIANPEAWHPMGEGIRRYSLKRFPNGLIYSRVGEDIVVLAVAHHRRRPGYWCSQLAGN